MYEQNASATPQQVWQTLDQLHRQDVVRQFQTVVKEMIDEHFRFDSGQTPRSVGQ